MKRNKPKIAVTMGDPAGVGPEICLDLLADPGVAEQCCPIVIGDRTVLESCAARTGKARPRTVIEAGEIDVAECPSILHCGSFPLSGFSPGEISSATGRAGYDSIVKAIDLALAGKVDAVTTAPIHKEALRSAGIQQPGHTEIFADRSDARRACMMLTSEALTCSFATVHVGYHEVPGLLSVERILDVIELTHDAMKRIRNRAPKIVVCGLNPHAGEHGLFGKGEEEELIRPAIGQAAQKGIDVEGPLPPDTAFLPKRREQTDAFVCMYHDQGHIPLKALAFDRAVNTTLGLPIVRTSVDHGTALDIAWQGKANSRSLFEAVEMAAKLGR